MKYPCKQKTLHQPKMIKFSGATINEERHGYSRPACVSVAGGSNQKRLNTKEYKLKETKIQLITKI